MTDVSDFETAWHKCPYCKKKVIIVTSVKDKEVELFTEAEYNKE